MIRDEIDIRKVRRLLEESGEYGRAATDVRDSFKHGYLLGKLAALDWVLGGPSEPVRIHYDQYTWKLEGTGASRPDGPPRNSKAVSMSVEQLQNLREANEWLKDDLDMMEHGGNGHG